MAKVLESLDFSTESGFWVKMVRIFGEIGPDIVWILISLVWNINWSHCVTPVVWSTYGLVHLANLQ